jgi:hypothetical protein
LAAHARSMRRLLVTDAAALERAGAPRVDD